MMDDEREIQNELETIPRPGSVSYTTCGKSDHPSNNSCAVSIFHQLLVWGK